MTRRSAVAPAVGHPQGRVWHASREPAAGSRQPAARSLQPAAKGGYSR